MSCQKEDLLVENENFVLENYFDPDAFIDVVPYTFIVDWNNGNPLALSDFDSIAIEYPIIYTAALTPQSLNIKSDVSFKVMVITNDGAPEFFINKYVNLDKSSSEDPNQFTGNVQTLNEHSEILNSRWYENGRFL